jgi:LuxR family maltose regulon positive regulatory protein
VTIPLLKTKLYIPPPRPDLVSRPRLIERLDEGLRPGCKLTLLSAPAGFGKTTLLSEWIRAGVGTLRGEYGVETLRGEYGVGTLRGEYGVGEEYDLTEGGASTPYSILPTFFAWLSLDEGDNDVARFWSYAISALQTLEPAIGQTALGALQASQAQPPPLEPLLISLVNDITTFRWPCLSSVGADN